MKLTIKLMVVAMAILMASCAGEDKKTETPAKKDSTVATLPPLDTTGFTPPATAATTEDSIPFRFNLTKGRSYDYTMVVDDSRQNKERVITTGMNWNYGIDVIDAKNTVKTLKVTYRTILMNMDMGGFKMEFSSEKKVEGFDLMQLPSKIFAAVKGKSFLMKVNEKGEILEVSGFAEIGEAVVNELELADAQKEMARKNFREQFNDESVKEMFSQAFSIFPGKPIKVGDKWTRQSKGMMGPDNMKINSTYTVRNIKNGKVYLDVKSAIDSGDPNVTGSQTGKLIVDATTGLVLDATMNQKLTGKGTMTTKSRITAKER